MTKDEGKPEDRPLMRLHALTNEIRKAGNENDLAATEGHIDDILKGELEKYTMGNTEAAETAALGLATHRLEHLIAQRRAALNGKSSVPIGQSLAHNSLMKAENLRDLRKRLTDPLLTALTIMLAVILFVVAPLQAAGVVAAHNFGLAFGLVLVATVFIVSESRIAVGAILISLGLVVVATVLRLQHPSVIDIYLDAVAWLITSIALGCVVAQAVQLGE